MASVDFPRVSVASAGIVVGRSQTLPKPATEIDFTRRDATHPSASGSVDRIGRGTFGGLPGHTKRRDSAPITWSAGSRGRHYARSVTSKAGDAIASESIRGAWTPPASPEDVETGLREQGYLPGEGLSTSVFLAVQLQRPLFLEGEPGVGKTEVANSIAAWFGTDLLRLQCYEGIDAHQAIYEWDYQRQMLYLRAHDRGADSPAVGEDELFSERFLIRRPLLQAIAGGRTAGSAPPVLLIDEIDRADDEFEAFLLEILANFTVTVPEIGTFRAEVPPVVVLTSNRTRDVHDALKRRALYHWVEHPDFDREVAIVLTRVPEVGEQLARQVTSAIQALRGMDLYKSPGVAEAIDWARALHALGREALDESSAAHTLGAVLKYREDAERARPELGALVATSIARG
jgi:MoxR-like ATPase